MVQTIWPVTRDDLSRDSSHSAKWIRVSFEDRQSGLGFRVGLGLGLGLGLGYRIRVRVGLAIGSVIKAPLSLVLKSSRVNGHIVG